MTDFSKFKIECETLKRNQAKKIPKEIPILIFGAGGFGRNLAKVLIDLNFDVIGFVETNPSAKSFNDLPIWKIDNFNQDHSSVQLIVGIYNRDVPFDLLKSIAVSSGFGSVLMPWDVYNEIGGQLGWKYWLSSQELLLNAINNIERVFNLLSDDESKETLLNICRFRLGLKDDYASFKHEDEQYFNKLTLDRFSSFDECSYIDCGAYNGDTFIEASKKLPITKAYLFEPDHSNYLELISAAKLSDIDPICLPLAVSDNYQILTFSGGGEGGSISVDGTDSIAAVALDQLLPNSNIDFIKFDVEGAEISALTGARELINRSRPTIVLSLYHRPSDIWEIPSLISTYCINYKFYLRQHFYNSFDSVLYAIPN